MSTNRHKKKMKLKFGDVVFNIINYSVFAAFTLICIFPFYYLFINTISDNELVRHKIIIPINHIGIIVFHLRILQILTGMQIGIN